jgi:hypothetical protein
MKSRLARLCAVILPMTCINGCSGDTYLKEDDVLAEQRELFNQLCNATDGSMVYQTANVDGYLSASNLSCEVKSQAWEPIVLYGDNYHECTDAKVSEYHLPDDVDIFRFTLKSKGSPLCGVGDKDYYSYQDGTGAKFGDLGWVRTAPHLDSTELPRTELSQEIALCSYERQVTGRTRYYIKSSYNNSLIGGRRPFSDLHRKQSIRETPISTVPKRDRVDF